VSAPIGHNLRGDVDDVVVVGAGCGSVIAARLAREGRRVTVVDMGTPGGPGPASGFRNHRIKHSGAIQQDVRSAARLWEAFSHMDPIESTHLRSRGASFLVRDQEVDDVCHRWRAAGIPFSVPSAPTGMLAHSRDRMRTLATPDAVIDYPAVIRAALERARAAGAAVMHASHVSAVVIDGDMVIGVRIRRPAGGARGTGVLLARHVVIAAGGWTPEVLASAGVALPIARWKSHILALEGELVPRLTVHLGPPLIVVVPVGGRTLFGDERRVEARSGNDLALDAACADALREAARHLVPRRQPAELEMTAGIKAEWPGHGSRAQDISVFDQSTLGVGGMTVALPGKASLMFALAKAVSGSVQRAIGPPRPGRRRPFPGRRATASATP